MEKHLNSDEHEVRRTRRSIFSSLRKHTDEVITPDLEPASEEVGDAESQAPADTHEHESEESIGMPDQFPGPAETAGEDSESDVEAHNSATHSELLAGAAESADGGSAPATENVDGMPLGGEAANGTSETNAAPESDDHLEPEANAREQEQLIEILDGSAAVDAELLDPVELPRVIAITNQKGGVGKTTTSVNLGAALAELGFRVLVIDLDPQGNASTGMGVNPRNVEHSIYEVILHDLPMEDAVEPTAVRNLFCVPATIDLAGAEIELVPAMMREMRLKHAIDAVKDDYDWVLIDCPPSLGLLTVNGLAASNDVIVPIQCEYYALEGLGQLLRNVSLIQQRINPSLKVRGIVLTMFDARTRLAEQVETDVREHFGDTVYTTVIPRTVRLSEAPSFGQPIIVFDPSSRGAVAYRDLAKEVSRGAAIRSR